MPITDPLIPPRVLDSLSTVGTRFAVLHQEGLVGTPTLDSDLDLVVAIPAVAALQTIREPLRAAGLRPAVLWPYDLGGTSTAFIVTSNGDEGAQIDFLFDPRGKGRYGIRGEVMLDAALSGLRYPVPHPVDQHLYMIRKGACKGQEARVRQGLAGLASLTSVPEALARTRHLFSPRAAAEMVDLLQKGEISITQTPARSVGNLWRRIGRVLKPIGLWAEVIGPEALASDEAAKLEGRFSRWLIRTGVSRRVAGRAGITWLLRQVAPVRARAGLFISWAEVKSWPPADVTILAGADGGIDAASSVIVEAFSVRAMR